MYRKFVQCIILMLILFLVNPFNIPAQSDSDYSEVSLASAQTALDLYNRFNDGSNANVFFSPYSINTVLALLYGGAEGKTEEQIASVLNLGQIEAGSLHSVNVQKLGILDAIGEKGDVQFSLSNSFWPTDALEVNDDFIDLLEMYRTKIEALDYRADPEGAARMINQWADESTMGIIKEIISFKIPKDTQMMLANAVYFKGNWIFQFDENDTVPMPFFINSVSSIEHDMMYQLGEFGYNETESAQILSLPYMGNDLEMIVVLPWRKDGLFQLEQQLSASDLLKWPGSLYYNPVEVYFPKFSIRAMYDLVQRKDLAELGMVDAFQHLLANFSGIFPRSALFYLRHFLHFSFIKVNEEGTEAAAVTLSGGCFPAGSEVLTPTGVRPIESFSDGDTVFSLDLEQNRWLEQKVEKVRSYDFAGDIITLDVEGEEISATWNHPFLVRQGKNLQSRPTPDDLPPGESVETAVGRWVEARDLVQGDVLVGKSDRNLRIDRISSKAERREVFSLEVNGIKNFCISEYGVIVHNEEGGKESAAPEVYLFQADHPFFFYIYNRETSTILFMGRLGVPSL